MLLRIFFKTWRKTTWTFNIGVLTDPRPTTHDPRPTTFHQNSQFQLRIKLLYSDTEINKSYEFNKLSEIIQH